MDATQCETHSYTDTKMYLTICPLVARVQLSAVAEYFKGFFPDWSQTLGEEMHVAKLSQTNLKVMRNTKEDSDSYILWHREMAAMLSSILICHILDPIKDT